MYIPSLPLQKLRQHHQDNEKNWKEAINIYIIDNLTYGDALQTLTGSFTRILCQNVNGIEFFHFAMRKFNIDIAGLSETSLHFANPQVKK